MSPLAFKTFAPEENDVGTWLILVAPANGEVVGGVNDGSPIFDPIDVDLLRLGKVLEEVEEFFFNPGNSVDGPNFMLSGRVQGNEVTIQIFLDPFDEDDPSWSLDVNRGTWNIPEE